MTNLIVLLVTNFWKASESASLVCNALRELSRRGQARGRRAVVKIMHDRGDVKQLVTPHQRVPPKVFADPQGPVRIPSPDELPQVGLEVVDYHAPPLGTFQPST